MFIYVIYELNNLNRNKMDKALRKMRVVASDRNKLAKKILRSEAGWDGKCPIPVKWFGGIGVDDLMGISLIHTSGDDECYWVADPVSALVLFLKGHDLEKAPEVLAKRKTFKD